MGLVSRRTSNAGRVVGTTALSVDGNRRADERDGEHGKIQQDRSGPSGQSWTSRFWCLAHRSVSEQRTRSLDLGQALKHGHLIDLAEPGIEPIPHPISQEVPCHDDCGECQAGERRDVWGVSQIVTTGRDHPA